MFNIIQQENIVFTAILVINISIVLVIVLIKIQILIIIRIYFKNDNNLFISVVYIFPIFENGNFVYCLLLTNR